MKKELSPAVVIGVIVVVLAVIGVLFIKSGSGASSGANVPKLTKGPPAPLSANPVTGSGKKIVMPGTPDQPGQ